MLRGGAASSVPGPPPMPQPPSPGLSDLPPALILRVCDFLPLRAACGSLPATCRWLRDVLCGVAIRGVTVSGSSTSSSGANISANAALGAGSPAAISGYGGPSTAARTAPAGSAVAGAGSRGWLSSAAAGQPQLGGAALPAEWWRRKAEEDLRMTREGLEAVERSGLPWIQAVLCRVRLRGAPSGAVSHSGRSQSQDSVAAARGPQGGSSEGRSDPYDTSYGGMYDIEQEQLYDRGAGRGEGGWGSAADWEGAWGWGSEARSGAAASLEPPLQGQGYGWDYGGNRVRLQPAVDAAAAAASGRPGEHPQQHRVRHLELALVPLWEGAGGEGGQEQQGDFRQQQAVAQGSDSWPTYGEGLPSVHAPGAVGSPSARSQGRAAAAAEPAGWIGAPSPPSDAEGDMGLAAHLLRLDSPTPADRSTSQRTGGGGSYAGSSTCWVASALTTGPSPAPHSFGRNPTRPQQHPGPAARVGDAPRALCIPAGPAAPHAHQHIATSQYTHLAGPAAAPGSSHAAVVTPTGHHHQQVAQAAAPAPRGTALAERSVLCCLAANACGGGGSKALLATAAGGGRWLVAAHHSDEHNLLLTDLDTGRVHDLEGHTRGVRDIAVATVAAADVPSGAGEEGPAGWAAAGVGPSGVGVSGRADGGGGATGGGSRAAGGSTVLLASAGWDNRLIVWDLQDRSIVHFFHLPNLMGGYGYIRYVAIGAGRVAVAQVHAVMVYDIATGNVHDVIMEDRWGAGRPDQQRFPQDLCMRLVRAMAMTANGRWLILATQTPAVDRYWVYDLEARAFATSLEHPAAPGRQVPLDEAVPVFCELQHSESRPVDTRASRQQHTTNQGMYQHPYETHVHPQQPEPPQLLRRRGHPPGERDPQQQQPDQQHHPLLLTAQRGPGGCLGPVWVWDLARGRKVAELRVSGRTPQDSDSIGGASSPGGGLQPQPHASPAPSAAVSSAPPASGAAHFATELAVAAASPAVALSSSADGSRLQLLNAAGQLALWDLALGQALLATAAAPPEGQEALMRDSALARGKEGAQAGAEALVTGGARGIKGAGQGALPVAAATSGSAAAPGAAAMEPDVWCNGLRCSRPPGSSAANAHQRSPSHAASASSPSSYLSYVAWPRAISGSGLDGRSNPNSTTSSDPADPHHRTTTSSTAGTLTAAAAIRELRRRQSSSMNPWVEWLSVPLASHDRWPGEEHQRLVLPSVADAMAGAAEQRSAAAFRSGQEAGASEGVLGASQGHAAGSGGCTGCSGGSAAGGAVVLGSVPPMWVWREVRCVAADWRTEVA